MSFGGGGGLYGRQLPTTKETIVTPNMIQAVAQTRIEDFVRAADRRRVVGGADESRRTPRTSPRSTRYGRRLRLGIA